MRSTEQLRARATGPRLVLCVIEDEHRDLAVADAVAAGRFTLAGVTRELGTEPDWIDADLPEDEEWRIEWSKFYFGLDLAHAFRTTGDRRYLDAWEHLVGSWIEQVPVGWDDADVAGRRLQNWLYAWQGFAAAPAFDGLAGDLERALRASIDAQARWVRDHLHDRRNHRTLELYALLVVALALPEADPDAELRDFAVAELHRNLLADFRPDGVHCEASTHYHMIALRSFVGTMGNARRFGLRLPDGFAAHVGRACDFALHCVRPDGGIPALSDADGGRYDAMLALAADVLDRDDLRHVATGGRAGAPPSERHASFPDGGYFVQRSGWGEAATPAADERYLIFDCGPLGDGGHGHYDLLSVEIAAAGRPLIVDPGRFTYAEGEPNLRRWFKGTAAHSTVCVDGRDQTPYRRGRPKGAVAEARFGGRLTAPGLDVLAGEASSPAYEAVHARTIAFVADAYWILHDRLRSGARHDYDLRLHLGPEAWGEAGLHRVGEQTTVRAPGLALVHAPGPEIAIEPGWVAPEYGVRRAAPVVSAVIAGASDADFTTLVVPLEDGRPAPALSVASDGPWTVVIVDGADARDEIHLAARPAPLELGPVRATAGAGWIRRAPDGRCLAAAACEPDAWIAWDPRRGLHRSEGGPA
jgi:hypothetical protein